MIKISYKKKDNHINYVNIKGHSGYAEEGFDIVCASVSSIVITTINALVKLDADSIVYKEDDGFLEVEIIKFNDTIDVLICNMISMLEELQKQYEDYIEIK